VDVAEDDDWAFAHAMVSLGQTLGLQMVAEGVENGTQADRLQRMGCDFAQGYFFARPLRPDTMLERIATGLAIPNRAARQPHLVAMPDSLGA
jgi:EAL domain-containing protein (putative c-di-GMP-specific phosphodiesterase class I)